MKVNKLIIVLLVSAIFFSCAKDEVVCKKSTAGLKTKVTITEEQYIVCSNTVCTTNDLGSTLREDYVKSLEAAGYTCK